MEKRQGYSISEHRRPRSLIQETGLTPMENDQTTELQVGFGFNIVGILLFQLFGRDFGVAEQEHLAYIQLSTIFQKLFPKDLCQSLPLEYQEEAVHHGITTYR